jgi:FecR protein
MSDQFGFSRLFRTAYFGLLRSIAMITTWLCRLRCFSDRLMGAFVVLICLCSAPVHGKPAGCTLVADEHSPTEKILRCGVNLTIRNAPGTNYQVTSPNEVKLNSGALLIEFAPGDGKKRFQILTPHAIASVRGTKWAVEVTPERTSTLVISGVVEVKRPKRRSGALLKAGEGSDVSAGSGGIVVKRWAQQRVDALLARFGQ